jgi:hypothetical protein
LNKISEAGVFRAVYQSDNLKQRKVTNMKRLMALAGIAAMVLALAIAHGQERKERRTQPFMREKLVYAQGILEGITLEKFDLVITNATRLRDMSMTNAFLRLGNPDYLRCMTNFQSNVDALKAAAKDAQRDRVFEAYVKVTESCVVCHRVFRREQFPKTEPAK